MSWNTINMNSVSKEEIKRTKRTKIQEKLNESGLSITNSRLYTDMQTKIQK